jgi:hypothetical protein
MSSIASILQSFEPEQVEQKYEMNYTLKKGVQRYKHMAQDDRSYEWKPSTKKIDYRSYVALAKAIKTTYNQKGIRQSNQGSIYKKHCDY